MYLFHSSAALTVLAFLAAASSVLGALYQAQFVITWESGAPNGQEREMIMINGGFPGPDLVVDEGDDVEITVHNRMPFNTTIHWHGLMMQGTPWSDGTPGLTQKPIDPGESFIYRFKASPSGMMWYHSHSRATLLDGLYGTLFIRPNSSAVAPWTLISNDTTDIRAMATTAAEPNVMLVSDWSHFKSWEYMAAENASGYSIFCTDSLLINGKGSVHCPGQDFVVNHTSHYMKYALYPGQVNDKGCFPFNDGTEKPYLGVGHPETIPLHLQKGCIPSSGESQIIEVDPSNGWASLSFVCAATFKVPRFTIDGHRMWVYAVDGLYIEPQLVDMVDMYAGERFAVMIKLDQPPKDYTIRVADSGLTQVISTFATLRYKNGVPGHESQGIMDYGGRNSTQVIMLDREFLPPYPPNAPALHSDFEHVLRTHRAGTAWRYTMNGGATYGDDQSAYTPLLYHPTSAAAENESLVIRTLYGQWVDLIVQVGSFADQPQEFPHIMHKHTGKTWKIGGGDGIWNYSSVDAAIKAQPAAFNLKNPVYRDTYVTTQNGPAWIVLRYQAVNPGAWLFHCHIETHLSGGMAVVIMDGIDRWPDIPPEYALDQMGFYP